MKLLHADFAVRRSMGAWPWVLLALLLSVFAGYQGWRAWNQQISVSALQKEQESLRQQVDLASQAQRETFSRLSAKPAYAADAAAIAKMASFPLARVLSAMESARVEGVRLTGLEISASEGSVRAELEFAEHSALLNYLEAINAGEPAPRWLLLQAQISPTAPASNLGVIVSTWILGRTLSLH